MSWTIYFGGAAFLAVVLVTVFLLWVGLSTKASPKLKERWRRIAVAGDVVIFLVASPFAIYCWFAFLAAIRLAKVNAAVFILVFLAVGAGIAAISARRAIQAWFVTS